MSTLALVDVYYSQYTHMLSVFRLSKVKSCLRKKRKPGGHFKPGNTVVQIIYILHVRSYLYQKVGRPICGLYYLPLSFSFAIILITIVITGTDTVPYHLHHAVVD